MNGVGVVRTRLRLPVICAPMFLLSGPELLIACSRAGIIGALPTPNARTPAILETWLQQIRAALPPPLPWAINLVMHRSNPRRLEDLAVAAAFEAPLVITALGSPAEAVQRVHAYGGQVFADVTTPELARRAADSGADGLALVCAGAGGHTGQLSPFAFVEEVRRFFAGPLILSGAIASGRAIRAAQVLGADYVYMGTRFIPASESLAAPAYKQMVIDACAGDIVTSDAITGVKANWLRPSLERAGYDPARLPAAATIDFHKAASDIQRWRDIWAAGQGVGSCTCLASVAEIVDELEAEYRQACTREVQR
jgi:nitronate monooxygenase